MRRLSVTADLDLVVDGHPVVIRGDGDRLRFEVDEPRTAWRLFRSNRPGRKLVRSITDTLDVFGVDVDVVVRGRPVASLGPSAQGGRLLNALGLPGVQVSGGHTGRQLRWVLVGAAFLGGVLLGARR